MNNPRIAFVGAGRMASAMVSGLLARGAAKADERPCMGGDDAPAAILANRTGIPPASNLEPLLATADTAIVACKPQQLSGLSTQVRDLTKGKLVLSILAGKRLQK